MPLKKLIKSLLPAKSVPDLDAQLAALEAEAAVPAMDFRAALFGRAGDLCVKSGEDRRALHYYGRAIDGYLGCGYYDTALAMCKKVVSLNPNVVRTRCRPLLVKLRGGRVVADPPLPSGPRSPAGSWATVSDGVGAVRLAANGLLGLHRRLADRLPGLGRAGRSRSRLTGPTGARDWT